MNRILANAQISKGVFYYHFQDKEALYLYLLKQGVKAKWEFISQAMQNVERDLESEDIFESFKLQARLGAQFAQVHPEYHLLSKMFAKEKGSPIYEKAKQELGKGGEMASLEAMIVQSAEQGMFRDEFSLDFVIRIITHLFTNFDEIFSNEEDLELDQMIRNLDSFVDFMKHGLGRRMYDEANGVKTSR